MEQIHKKTNGIGHNSNILKDKSPTAEAIEEQLFKVGEIINDITSKLFRVEEEYRGAKVDEIVVNPYERPDDDPLGSTRVYRKASKYEQDELHFLAQEKLQDVNNRLTHLHLNIDSFINGDIKEVSDKSRSELKSVREAYMRGYVHAKKHSVNEDTARKWNKKESDGS